VSHNRSVYPFGTSSNSDDTDLVTVLAIEIRKLQATEQKQCRRQTWTPRLTRANGTLASNATQWSATISAQLSGVNRRSRRVVPILRRLRHTRRRTNRTSRTAKAAKLLNARMSVLNIFQSTLSSGRARHLLGRCRRCRLYVRCASSQGLARLYCTGQGFAGRIRT
jgi:hypothetical protein